MERRSFSPRLSRDGARSDDEIVSAEISLRQIIAAGVKSPGNLRPRPMAALAFWQTRDEKRRFAAIPPRVFARSARTRRLTATFTNL
jgi:hypothetical protein